MPYFENLCGWKAASAANTAQALSAPSGEPEETAAKPKEPGSDAEPLRRGISWFSWLSDLALRLIFPSQPQLAPDQAAAPSAFVACAAQTELSMPAISARTELVEHVEECELEALELLLKCLYKAEVPKEAWSNIRLLLQMFRLADKYEVPAACLQLVLSALAAIETKGIDLPLMSEVYSLPLGLLEVPLLQNIVAACKRRLVELFGNVPAVIIDLEQRRQFCALPYAAVLAWLRSDDLEVHSESCVVFLLSAWLNNKGPTCSPDQQKEFAHNVRVAHLSDMYLHCVLPDSEWFMKHCDSGAIGVLRALQLRKCRPDADCRTTRMGPPSWNSGKRKGTAIPESTDIVWKLEPKDIMELDASDSPSVVFNSPNSTYLNGVFYRLRAQKVEAANNEAAVTLGLYLCLDAKAMEATFGIWDCNRHPCLYGGELSVSTAMKRMGPVVTSNPDWGFKDILGRSAATIAELVSQLLVDGRLSLKAAIKSA